MRVWNLSINISNSGETSFKLMVDEEMKRKTKPIVFTVCARVERIDTRDFVTAVGALVVSHLMFRHPRQ
jgi:hypothetical protein